MARAINRLSARTVQTLKEHGRHADGQGLYLVIDAKGRRWVYMYPWRGKRREMGLGSPPAVGLADAREARERAAKLLSQGLDPIEERRKARAAEDPKTFGDIADALVESLAPGFKSAKHLAQWRKTFHRTEKGPGYAEALMSRPVSAIATSDVLEVLTPLWKDKPETAGRVRGRIEAVLDTARAQGAIVGAWENPARWRGHLQRILPRRAKLTRGHQRAISYEDVPPLMVALDAKIAERDAVGIYALKFTILCVKRESEVLGAEWSEFDLDKLVWTIPGRRMKGQNPPAHREPITPTMLKILEHMRGAHPVLVFPGRDRQRPMSNATMDRILERLGVNATPHGFRSTFRDWVGEATNFPERLAEQALSHIIPDKTERAYRRGDALDKRRAMMEAWDTYCTTPKGVVVPLMRPV